MSVLATISGILAGACLFAALTHLVAGLRQSSNATHLAFALLALFVGLFTLCIAWMYRASDAAQYVHWLRWGYVFGSLALAALPWFAHFYTATGSRPTAVALSGLYLVVAIASALMPYGLFVTAPPQLIQLEMWWGETATAHESLPLNGLIAGYFALHLCTFVYIFRACAAHYRRGQRRQAIALASATAVFALGMIETMLVTAAGLHSIYVAQYAFVALVLLMMFWLGSDESFRAIVTQASDGIFIADCNGNYTHVNAAGCALLGYSAAELDKMCILDVVPPGDVALVAAERTALLAGRGVRRELQFLRKDGSTFTGELTASMLSDGRLIGIVRDTSERQRILRTLEERVAARTAEYVELNRQLASFSYSVSHDLRAPVRAVAAFSSILLNEHAQTLDENARRHLGRIQAAARHMNELIEGLLLLANVSHQTLLGEQVDLREMSHQIVEGLRERDPSRHVEVTLPSSWVAFGDARLLGVLMQNLIENAWKYTSLTDGAHIELGSDSTSDELVYYVSDNGAGFSMAHAEQLFQPFKRLHSATEFSGTGVGLATVARIVERHGGRIWAQAAAPGKGATFCFTLCGQGAAKQHAPASGRIAS